jgi:hypothetical protein
MGAGAGSGAPAAWKEAAVVILDGKIELGPVMKGEALGLLGLLRKDRSDILLESYSDERGLKASNMESGIDHAGQCFIFQD